MAAAPHANRLGHDRARIGLIAVSTLMLAVFIWVVISLALAAFG